MDKIYEHKKVEHKIYQMWEESGYFRPKIDPQKKPFTILLPPPNASGKMHTGNVLMIAIEDLLIRWHRMKGDPALWLPGTDHAGTETQITFEKQLKKQGKSRFSYSREELYNEIMSFVQNNKQQIESQIRQMGASIDWSRYTFMLDEKVIKTVHNTFKKLASDNLIYRGDYIVNYCTKCGTTYSDVEIKYEERKDPLYYLIYGPFILATVRPETKFGDTAVAVNPKDKRYQKYIGKEIEAQSLLGKFKLKVIADHYVDPEFGTGVVKVTPAHDKNDFEAGLRHNLEVKSVIDITGKLNKNAGKYSGLSVLDARKQVVKDLLGKNLIDHIDENYIHTIALCKAGHQIEPLVLPNWFISIDARHKSLKKPAYSIVKDGGIKIYPKWRESTYLRWLEEMRDWPISRQNVWGIRIPVWYQVDGNEERIVISFIDKAKQQHMGTLDQWLNKGFSFKEIEAGLQRIIVPVYEAKENNPRYLVSEAKPTNGHWIQETDTFDTWFSSGQWPLVTLGYPDSSDFKYFYPTSVMETGWEIIRLWVSRMIIFGLYLTGKPPFAQVYLHGIVRALDGRKMSKSLGNVIDPDEYIEQFGVDALRMGLIAGTANGKDFNFPRDRVIAFKHFGNKIWNMARFILMMREQWGEDISEFNTLDKNKLNKEDIEIINQLRKLISKVDVELEKFRFADAADAIYHYMWHELADKYIEHVKAREDKDITLTVLTFTFTTCLKLLHPFMPFITEEIFQHLVKDNIAGLVKSKKSIMIESWPSVSDRKS